MCALACVALRCARRGGGGEDLIGASLGAAGTGPMSALLDQHSGFLSRAGMPSNVRAICKVGARRIQPPRLRFRQGLYLKD